MSQHSQFSLLKEKRFLPFFLTQFLGAFNDNLFKQAIVLAILYKLAIDADRDLLVNLCALLFIFPMFLFSALGGQMGEKYNKDSMIRILKLVEIAIMLLGAAGFLLDSLPIMLVALFGMGTHSALFGPVKYSLLPQQLKDTELVGGNAMVEMGTFLAILGGTLGAGFLMEESGYATLVAGSVLIVAVAGFLASCGIPRARAAVPSLKLDWNVFRQSYSIVKMGLQQRPAVSRSLIGNSWFWFLGAVYLAQIPGYAKDFLHGDSTVVSLILAIFSIGIALGSLLCERLSGGKIEIGLVPFGSVGLTLFSLLLWWHSDLALNTGELYSWSAVLQQSGNWPVLLDILLIGIFGGFYIVPLYALIQSRTPEDRRARVIAANNILNALFMVVAALLSMFLLTVLELNIAQLFLTVALLNVLVNLYIFKVVPEFAMRFLVWLLGHSMYRVEHRNLDVIPDEGAYVLVCNHISYVDALLLAGAIRRPIRFVSWYKIYNLPVMHFIFSTAGAVPIAARHEDEQIYEQAFGRIADYLRDGELVCIFPEGKLTPDGEIQIFRGGVERILQETPVPVIPLALQGLWGSFFSRDPQKGFFRRTWSRITLVAGKPIPAEEASCERLQQEVTKLRGDRK